MGSEMCIRDSLDGIEKELDSMLPATPASALSGNDLERDRLFEGAEQAQKLSLIHI